MKYSRIYEGLLIIFIIVIVIKLILISGKLVELSDESSSDKLLFNYNDTHQIDQPTLLFGPMERSHLNHIDHSNEPNHYSRVTTYNGVSESSPLVPKGVSFTQAKSHKRISKEPDANISLDQAEPYQGLIYNKFEMLN